MDKERELNLEKAEKESLKEWAKSLNEEESSSEFKDICGGREACDSCQ